MTSEDSGTRGNARGEKVGWQAGMEGVGVDGNDQRLRGMAEDGG